LASKLFNHFYIHGDCISNVYYLISCCTLNSLIFWWSHAHTLIYNLCISSIFHSLCKIIKWSYLKHIDSSSNDIHFDTSNNNFWYNEITSKMGAIFILYIRVLYTDSEVHWTLLEHILIILKTYLNTSEHIWTHLNISDPIWTHLNTIFGESEK
jgi:hypothetical protein